MRARLVELLRERARERRLRAAGARCAADGFEARVHAELAEELPDEDLGEDLADFLDRHQPGADPEADEELLERVREARDRIARGY
ncbi:hypothetical protein ACO0M4_21310 [Streptomyces sp. RGM 3693]|uniref:hypothetical protein n=1 Tax=Streptomyces sp. RGM 3693 TaxID=3413284 RepID=UPI003D2AE37A